MTVIACDLINSGRSLTISNTKVRVYNETYLVQTNDPRDDALIAIQANLGAGHKIPTQYTTTYSSANASDSLAFCTSVKASPYAEDDRQAWKVEVEYRTDAFARYDNPLLDPVVYSMGFDSYQTVARFDNNGDTIRNSFGDLFNPPPMVDQSRPVYVVQRNEPAINLSLAMQIKDSVNVSAWKGCAPRTVKCRNISYGETQTRNSYTFYKAHYEFHLDVNTWDFRVLNTGRRYMYDDPANPGTLIEGKKTKSEDPVVMYIANDEKVAEEDLAAGGIPPDDIYLRIRYYREMDFSILGL